MEFKAIIQMYLDAMASKDTKYHDRIVALVNANLDIIRVLDVNHKQVERKELRKLKKAS